MVRSQMRGRANILEIFWKKKHERFDGRTGLKSAQDWGEFVMKVINILVAQQVAIFVTAEKMCRLCTAGMYKLWSAKLPLHNTLRYG